MDISRYTLTNGMRLVVHPAPHCSVATFNMLYTVGSRNEKAERTGFAHLFEHLMFGGSEHAPDYDMHVQRVGGDSNAFTTPDFTNYHTTMPVDNLETAFWLDSDRMLSPTLTQKSLEVQRKVVVEEFRQRYLNQPYGDAMHQLRDLAYTTHPYKWPTIGLTPQHIEEASLQEVRDFFFQHYIPRNAILSIAGNVEPEKMRDMAEKWFSEIVRDAADDVILQEPEQRQPRRREVTGDVPADHLYIAFHKDGRQTDDYLLGDLLTDILADGESSRLVQDLIREKRLSSDANSYITSSLDPGLVVFSADCMPGVEIERVEERIWELIRELAEEGPSEKELQKTRNRHVSMRIFEQVSTESIARGLAMFEMIGDARMINTASTAYDGFTPEDVKAFVRRVCRPENSSTLVYRKKA